MSRTNKWPAKAVNLLVALAMVISLCVVFAPAVAAETPHSYNPDCEPVQEFNGCNLEVYVNTYTKDANGDFTADYSFDECNYFYLNAVVVNTGNESTTAPITGNITNLGSIDVSLYSCEGNVNPQTSVDDVIDPGEIVDFWWKLHCDAGTGDNTITVQATSNGCVSDTASAYVYQTVPEVDKCVTIEIIEAPGLNSELEQTVVPCTNFGIKANITNNCSYMLYDVNGTIEWYGETTPNNWVKWEHASMVGVDPLEWCVGDLAPGEWATVGWTLHCDEPGDIKIWVKAEDEALADDDEDCLDTDRPLHPKTTYINDPWTVHQLGAGELEVVITSPPNGYEVCQDCTINDLNQFTVDATITNNSDAPALGVYAIIVGNDTDLFDYESSTMVTIGDMAAGATADVSYDLSCIAPGALKFTVTAYFTTTEGPGTSEDIVLINQNELIATVYEVTARDPVVPDFVVNVCDTFDVVGSFLNCSGEDLTYVDVCILYRGVGGNVTLILDDTVTDPDTTMNPVYDRCLGAGWHLFDGTETGTSVLDTDIELGSGWYKNCQQVAICECCETRVRWTFQCTEEGLVEAYVYMTKTVGPDTWEDDSEVVTIGQVWKAHLIAGLASYLQNECGAMLQRDAFAPCQDFHVVMPVVNVGDADAENVVVNFAVIEAPAGPVWDLEDIVTAVSGDVTDWSFNETTGLGTATIGTIAGNSTKKVILHLHCAGEGTVQILISGIAGMDENTGKAIHPSNIELPPCPIAVEQIPFTVEIINPTTCETFNPGDRFAVKALIRNDSDTDLGTDVAAVWAKLHWTVLSPVALVDSPPQNNPKRLGNATDFIVAANSIHEVTWEMQCTGPGEVYLWVTVTSDDPYLTTTSGTVNVHQTYLPNVDIVILSPPEHVWIATSQEFAVTARVNNTGPVTAEDVEVSIDSGNHTSVVEGDNPTVIGDLLGYDDPGYDPNGVIVTWTLHCDETGELQCAWGNDTICVSVETTSEESDTTDNDECKQIHQYPAAHLEVEICDEMETTISVCDEFVVPFTVTNTGEADATEVSVTLSVTPEGSARPVAGDGGYTLPIGTIPGWGSAENYKEGNFTLHCKVACESTITITAAGIDECGWEIKQLCDYDQGGGEFVCALYPHSQPYLPILERFIEPDSVTVKQLAGLDLGITKTVNDPYPAPENVEFTITVTNYGPENASGVEVTDALPGGLTLVTADATQGTYSAGVWDIGGLVKDASATLIITATAASEVEMTNTATISAVDQTDGLPQNDSASVTIYEEAVTSVAIGLDAGWNLISMPLIPTNNDLETMLTPVWGDFVRAFKYDGCTETWTSYIKDGPTPSLTTLDDGFGYWIMMDDEGTITVSGVVALDPPALPPSYGVCEGWNLIGFKSTDEMAAGGYLAALQAAGVPTWTRVWGFANGMYSIVDSDDMMTPGFGYWLALLADGTVYP